jgi:hypothetical protein
MSSIGNLVASTCMTADIAAEVEEAIRISTTNL